MPNRKEIIEYIEVTITELRGIAQPRDVAELRTLAMDAEDADTEQLGRIHDQVRNLREFCEKRSRSTAKFPSVFPPPGRRRAE